MIDLTKHNMIVAGFASVYFIIFSLPMVYAVTGDAIPLFLNNNKCPSLIGIIFHGVFLFFVMYATMAYIEKMIKDNLEKSS